MSPPIELMTACMCVYMSECEVCCAGSVDFSDSDEEEENVAGISDSTSALSSFPVDSWEDTWDDSDAPVSQEVSCCSSAYPQSFHKPAVSHQACCLTGPTPETGCRYMQPQHIQTQALVGLD